MMRWAVALVVAANLAYWAFASGHLDGWFGLSSLGDREPQRLARQVRPEAVRTSAVTPARSGEAAEAASAAAGASAPAGESSCWEAGPVPEGDAWAAERALANTLPAGAWRDVRTEAPQAGQPPAHLYRVPAADAALAARLARLTLVGERFAFRRCTRAGG